MDVRHVIETFHFLHIFFTCQTEYEEFFCITYIVPITITSFFLSVTEIQSGETLNIKAEIVSSPRKDLLVKPEIDYQVDSNKACYMCSLNLNVKHTDVLILSQFIRNDGCMLPRRITGLCKKQQKKIGTMVQMAHKAGKFV